MKFWGRAERLIEQRAVSFSFLLGIVILLCAVPSNKRSAFGLSITNSANVINNCSISSTYSLAFGSYDPVVANSISGSDLNANGTIGVTCTKNDSIKISLDNGQHFASPNRQMASGANFLQYNIYTSNAYTTIWNSTYTVTQTSSSGLSPTNFTMYGKVFKGQDIPNGAYTDTVVATISY